MFGAKLISLIALVLIIKLQLFSSAAHTIEQTKAKPLGTQRYELGCFEDEKPEDYYLPLTMIPHMYNITLAPNFETNSFEGNVRIFGRNDAELTTIVLHELRLFLSSYRIYVNNTAVSHFSVKHDSKREFVIIELRDAVAAHSTIELDLTYLGSLDTTKKNRGFYIATYIDENGIEKRLATTHLEPTNAREVFPCFDEPALKAVFNLAIIRPNGFNTKTNTPLKQTVYYNECNEMDIFETTPEMSTYLIAIVVSEFETIESSYPGQTVHQLHGDVADLRVGYGDLGLLSSREVITALEEYTGVKFGLKKIGQVAIPEGYFGGAMENWGLVIYGEGSLLFKQHISTEIQRQGVVDIIAHEYAHQWFGNLVGPATWAYTWLNEGFATFFAMRIPSIINPSSRFDEQFAWKIQYAMSQDASDNTRPMTMPVGKPSNIQSTFDVIAYDKSACVLRMFESVLGADNFRKALNIYLTKRQYAAATADDLISSFQSVLSDVDFQLSEDIKTIFDSWHLQKGFPLVTATRDYEKNTLTLKQERFLLSKTSTSNTSQIWHIPINYFFVRTSTAERLDTSPQVWFNQSEMTIQLPAEAADSYIVLNKEFTGYYRVNYDLENWERIIASAKSLFDMSKNRVQLIDDAFTLVYEHVLPIDIALRLMMVLQYDDDSFLTTLGMKQYVNKLDEVLHEAEAYDDFKNSMIQTFKKAYSTYSHVEFDDDYVQTMVRNDLLARMCRWGYQECLNDMHEEMFKDYVLDSPNLQESVVCAGMMNPSNADEKFDILVGHINATKVSEVRSRLMRALTCTKDQETGIRLFSWILHPETNFLNWNQNTLLSYYTSDYDNAKFALELYLGEFVKLHDSYSIDALRIFLMTIVRNIYSQQYADHISEFINNNTSLPEPFLTVFMDAIKVIEANIAKIGTYPWKSFKF